MSTPTLPLAWSGFSVRRFTHRCDLLAQIVGRDMKILYKRSVLGVLWSLLNPLMQLVVFVFVFQRVLEVQMPERTSYPAFTFVGILAWTWFSASLSQSASAVTGSKELIKRPGFPAAILPVATLIMNLIHYLLALPILLVFLLSDRAPLNITLFLLPVVIGLQFIVTLSLGYLVATANVIFRDTQHIVSVLLPLMFYLTPIFYDPARVPAQYGKILLFNPMNHVITAYRAIFLFGKAPDWSALAMIAAIAGVVLFLTHRFFMSVSSRFVDEL
ncbi:MAG: ABC transporter permease [Chthoniobacterales bacterium]|nr:ABC transporter permease [Chthoniobacterales bacterium]